MNIINRDSLPVILTLSLGLAIASTVILLSVNNENDSSENSSGTKSQAPKRASAAWLGSGKELSDTDIQQARIAWKYFENNYQPKTGLVNAADQYPSTTMWDTGSTLGATIAAKEFDIITQKEFDDRVITMMETLSEIKLFDGVAPNKVYNTISGEMVDYGNNVSAEGIGISTLDLARLASWLNILSFIHPKYTNVARNIILRWNYTDLIQQGQMFGMARDPVTKKIDVLQEGRLGYEQYCGKIFQMFGFDQSVSATYNNKFATSVLINNVPIAYDKRDPRKLGAYNYVVTESYVMDIFENGLDDENGPLTENIFEVQKRRWQKTGKVTAVSEDNINRPPYFVYNTIFAAGSEWNAITDTGKDMSDLKTLSTKAALSLYFLYPEREYSEVLYDAVSSAYDSEMGWYSGVYENGYGYNDIATGNTNGVILTGILFKKYGSLNKLAIEKNRVLKFTPEIINAPEHAGKGLPGQER
ncbi:MAG: DUF3131 domain-containing protein [Methylococcales bacterium]|nr:DUF3131 domain-containing protein [Methylococcales bacterium]